MLTQIRVQHRITPLKGYFMKYALLTLVVLSSLAAAIPAKAGCNGTYHCTTTYNGKQQCSC